MTKYNISYQGLVLLFCCIIIIERLKQFLQIMKAHLNAIKVLKHLITFFLAFAFVSFFALIISAIIFNNYANISGRLNISKKKNNLIVSISIDGLGSNLIQMHYL